MTNRKGRNREASEQKGREKATQIGEKGVIIKGDTKKILESPLIIALVPFICYRGFELCLSGSVCFTLCNPLRYFFKILVIFLVPRNIRHLWPLL